jgi:hypothetical protein
VEHIQNQIDSMIDESDVFTVLRAVRDVCQAKRDITRENVTVDGPESACWQAAYRALIECLDRIPCYLERTRT